MSALNELSAVELLTHYRDRRLSPVEVTQAVLDRIAACEPQIHATYALDAEQALAMARASQRRWADGALIGPPDGVPVTLKENIATQGVPMPLGSAATPLSPANADGPAAARLREAGAAIVSKTTMPEFGMLPAAPSTFHPLTRNPWDLGRTTGGSSSGAGAAAAAGYGPLHLGTDIGGSVRIPANFCGIFGLKPSFGRIPVDPPFLGRCIGPMTRTVTDLLGDVFFTVPFNVSEQPAFSVNCGYTAGGLPIGLQIAGRRFDDLGVLQMARAYERMRPAQRAWPQPTGR